MNSTPSEEEGGESVGEVGESSDEEFVDCSQGMPKRPKLDFINSSSYFNEDGPSGPPGQDGEEFNLVTSTPTPPSASSSSCHGHSGGHGGIAATIEELYTELLEAVTVKSSPSESDEGADADVVKRLVEKLIEGSKLLGDEDYVDVQNYLDQEIYPRVCSSIAEFNSLLFDSMQDYLLNFIYKDWAQYEDECDATDEECQIIIIEFIANILAFIVKVGPYEIFEEYMKIFSHPSNPPHVLFIILPALLTASNSNTCTFFKNNIIEEEEIEYELDSDQLLFDKLLGPLERAIKNEKNSISDIKYIYSIWDSLNEHWLDKSTICQNIDDTFYDKILLLSTQTAYLLANCDVEELFQIVLEAISKFLYSPQPEPKLLVSVTIFLHSFQSKAQYLQWPKLSVLLSRVVDGLLVLLRSNSVSYITYKYHKNVSYFASRGVVQFIERAELSNAIDDPQVLRQVFETTLTFSKKSAQQTKIQAQIKPPISNQHQAYTFNNNNNNNNNYNNNNNNNSTAGNFTNQTTGNNNNTDAVVTPIQLKIIEALEKITDKLQNDKIHFTNPQAQSRIHNCIQKIQNSLS